MNVKELNAKLIRLEKQYGGLTKVKRGIVSPYDPRSPDALKKGTMLGGDRMEAHGYAPLYAQSLISLLNDQNEDAIIEIGVLKGSGVAMWCHLFPSSIIYGFDVDLSHIEDNIRSFENLKLYYYDQFEDNKEYLKSILGNKKVKMVVDDGFHSNHTILKTLDALSDYLSRSFIYFIEDNVQVHKIIQKKYPQFNVFYENQLTILTRSKHVKYILHY